tara:strand:+ start:46207 stop:47916 length:1710 start_codon:yes stop_codon:yes gene_type:complete
MTAGLQATTPVVVPTYESAGIYWKPNGGGPEKVVNVAFREMGHESWQEALPLWFDPGPHTGVGAEHAEEYRGSIVYLNPGTVYELRLTMEEGPEEIIQFQTRSDDFKIARTIELPDSPESVFVIDEGGNAADGYVLYKMPEGVTWDAQNQLTSHIEVNASFVILDGLVLTGAINNGIVLGDVHDVIIQNCDISNWGEYNQHGAAKNYNSAVFSNSSNLERITVQYSKFHHPRTDSNSWNQRRPGARSSHPEGAEGISFLGSQGGHVIRFNSIYSDIEHMFYDGIGGAKNFSYSGFPFRDSDIHDNFISHCWDDALEIEGANMNVRVWNNYMDMTYGAIGAASPSLGPIYFFRNVYAVSRKHEGTEPNDFRGHYLVKLGGNHEEFTRGKMYVFHNTALQPPPFPEFTDLSSGAQSGMVFTTLKKQQYNITSRNNIFQVRKPSDWSIRDAKFSPTNDYDYDMFDGRIRVREDAQANGIQATPIYRRTSEGLLELVPGTPGHDAGVRLPNFNDQFVGDAPDMGAVETNADGQKPTTWPEFPDPVETAASKALAESKESQTTKSEEEEVFIIE